MYKIQLPNFEGPFDLLLYFIRRDEVDIYDIPIARITEDFLSYIRIMKLFDLELAGEFILMASNLMYIKSQMLLPQIVQTGEDGEPLEDPRKQLVQRLLEYKQFKDAADHLKDLEEKNRYTYYRHMFYGEQEIAEENAVYRNATLFDLIKAFKQVSERLSQASLEHVVDIAPISVEMKSDMIMAKLQLQKRFTFFDYVKGTTVQNMVVTFLSLLELVKSGKIFIKQDEMFEDIIIALIPEREYREEHVGQEEVY